jgi:hypothetical protein
MAARQCSAGQHVTLFAFLKLLEFGINTTLLVSSYLKKNKRCAPIAPVYPAPILFQFKSCNGADKKTREITRHTS